MPNITGMGGQPSRTDRLFLCKSLLPFSRFTPVYTPSMPDEIPSLGEEIDEVVFHSLTPELLHAYEERKQEYRAALANEHQHFKGAEWYLRSRKAPREEIENLRVKSEGEIRRIKNEFNASIRALLYRFDCADC